MEPPVSRYPSLLRKTDAPLERLDQANDLFGERAWPGEHREVMSRKRHQRNRGRVALNLLGIVLRHDPIVLELYTENRLRVTS